MQTLFVLLALASMLGILLGLIKPTLVLHWGAKRTRLRAVGWYLLFTVICLVATGITSPKGQIPNSPHVSAPVAEATPPKPQQPAQPADAPQAFKPGAEIPVGKFVYIINAVKFAKRLGNSMVNETADGVFLVVDMTIRNNDTETRMLDSGLFKIKDASGTEYEPASRGATAVELSGGKTLFLKQCQPKIPTKGALVFEVPAQGQPYFLELSGGYWSGQHAKVALQ